MQLYLKFYTLATPVTIMVLRLVIDHVFIFAADSIKFRGDIIPTLGYFSHVVYKNTLPCWKNRRCLKYIIGPQLLAPASIWMHIYPLLFLFLDTWPPRHNCEDNVSLSVWPTNQISIPEWPSAPPLNLGTKCCTISHVLVTWGWLKMTRGAGASQWLGEWITMQLSLWDLLGCDCHSPFQTDWQR